MAEKYLDDDALAREVDKLLRKLPGADPYLRGDPEPAPARPATTATGSRPGYASAPRPAARPGPTRVQRISVWVRVVLGLLLGVLITQWPYSSGCGWGLFFYLGAVTAIVVGGVWAGLWSWRYRMGWAHSASIAVVYWGGWLFALEVLGRVGYAAVGQTWMCGR